jgi:N-acyl-D-aspartate/D-glutamate deacylase
MDQPAIILPLLKKQTREVLAMRLWMFVFGVLCLATHGFGAQQYDLVFQGGRVLDPATNLDGIRNVGIVGGKIARVASEALVGKRVIDASGLVVAPGFIDLHQHGQDLESQRVKALDGVTTALELEIGAPDVARFLQAKEGRSLINYGTSASHAAARVRVFGESMPLSKDGTPSVLPKTGHATDDVATAEQVSAMAQRLRSELDAGALAVGMGLSYTPGASYLEVIDIFRVAAERGLPVYTHARSAGTAHRGVGAVSEVIAASAVTGAPLHLVHLNSTCLSDSPACLAMIRGAVAHGMDITTEAYPYTAGMTAINSALFNPGWQEALGISYDSLVLPETGEHLKQKRFEELHASANPQWVLVFANTQEVVDKIIPDPLVMIASDGAPGHPRNAGTFSRVLAQYVREKGTVSLADAIRKMSYLPAQMLERSSPAAQFKGRLQEGADADIAVFNPATIQDQATYQKPMEASTGVRYLVVGGTLIVDGGQIVPNVFPGRAIVSPGAHPLPVHP